MDTSERERTSSKKLTLSTPHLVAICKSETGTQPTARNVPTFWAGPVAIFTAGRLISAARPLFERARAISEKALGSEHPQTATCLVSLALLLRDQGDLGRRGRSSSACWRSANGTNKILVLLLWI